ncbi:alpha/beta fold hydrolase [Mobilicoccus pelagius]|uniref:Peptidase S33 family protein n=1 Tax=Mobilicoccus pelagius NBRC 104925 TaxID=1089455 RepID=H5UN53_9MICO|nr:alpha/beta hydrolase [Mobilicoccus pelagius]GAB47161.1 peptidase S33 family protein [Mobilicoccus pelagius NBRC 104925]
MLAGPTGAVEYLSIGEGTPSTVFAHGLGGSISTTRPFASGVPGRRTFLHFRGHGASEAPETAWTYPALAGELRAVADHVDATRCLGVSMGAGAMCALLEETPDRFDRIVFVIPALIDRQRTDAALQRLVDLADLVDDRDVEGIAAHFVDEQPPELRERPVVQAWAQEQARLLSGTPVATALRALPHAVPLTDRASLSRVTAPALVIGQEGDDAHPESIAREFADVLPHAELEILPPGGVLWSHRSRVRALVSAFLSD